MHKHFLCVKLEIHKLLFWSAYMAKVLEARAGKNVIAFWKRVGHKPGTTQPIRVRVATVDLAKFKTTVMPGFELSDVEKLEINQEIEMTQLVSVNEKAAENAHKACEGLRELNPNFDMGKLARNDPDALWRGLMIVEKALKAAGHDRPKRVHIQKIPDTKTGDLLKR